MFDLDSDLLLTLGHIPIRSEAAENLVEAVGGAVPLEVTPALLVTSAYVNESDVLDFENRNQLLFWMDVLNEVGGDVLSLAILLQMVTKMGIVDSGELTVKAHQAKPDALCAMNKHIQLSSLVHLGRGQNSLEELATVTNVAGRKLLAAICLFSGFDKAMEMISPFVDAALSQPSEIAIDYKTPLQSLAGSKKLALPEYEIVRVTGPDHQREYHCKVKVAGIEGTGVGRSKKIAEQDAACQVLKRLKVPVKTKQSPSSTTFGAIRTHSIPDYQASSLKEAQNRLNFVFDDLKLLSIALVHTSHINESNGIFPFSNRPLATIGSKVLHLIAKLPVLVSPRQWQHRTIDNYMRTQAMVVSERILGQLGRRLGLLDLVLVSRGLAANLTDSLAAEVVQSCLGGMFLDVGLSLTSDRMLKSHVVKELNELQESLAGFESMIDADPVSLLQEVTRALGIHVSYDIVAVTGPDHLRLFTAEVTISGEGRAFRFRGRPTPNKGTAWSTAASVPLRAVAGMVRGEVGVSGFLRTPSGKRFIELLILRLLETLKSGPGAWKVLCHLHIFGANDITGGSRNEARLALESLFEVAHDVAPDLVEELQSRIVRSCARIDPGVRVHLRRVAEEVLTSLDEYQLEASSPLQSSLQFRDLLAVSALSARLQRMNPRLMSAGEVLFALGSIRNLKVSLPSNFDPEVDFFTDLGHMLELISVVAREAEATGANGLRLDLKRTGSFTSVTIEGIGIEAFREERMQLLNALAASASVHQSTEGLRIDYPRQNREGSEGDQRVEETVQAIFDVSAPDPLVRPFAAAAHDLKNLLLAIDGQVSNATQVPARRYQHLAAAEQTLFTARATARAMLLLFQTLALAEYQPFVLTELLKQFVADLHRRVPEGITLQSMQDSSAVVIQGDQYLLHAALENLCKNALEALGPRGLLRIEWLYDPECQSVLIEIADSGPGIPEHVIAALAEGLPVQSQKAQGCGLGLLSVQHIVKIHGGAFSVRHRPPGTVCSLVLPARPIEDMAKTEQQVVETVETLEGDDDAN